MPSTSVFRGRLLSESITINIGGAVDVTLLPEQARFSDIVLTGVVTAAVNIIIPVADPDDWGQGIWRFTNNTTGAFNVGVKQPNGVPFILPQGLRTQVEYTSSGFRAADTSVAAVRLGARYVREQFLYEPVTSKRLGGAVTGATGDRNQALFPSTLFEWHVKGTQTILTPVLTAVGWDIGMDQTAADGIELTNGILARCPVAFVVGTDAPFFFKVRAKVGDASGANPFIIGFRKAEAYQAVHTAYADYAAIGIVGTANPNTIQTVTETAGGGTTTTDTTNTWADAAIKTLGVFVAANGAVTYQIENVAPTVVAAYSFAAAAVVVPYLYFLNAADLVDTLELIDWEVGFQ